MKTHLSEGDFSAVVAGFEVTSEAREHLASCVSCRQQVAEMQRFIADRRKTIEAEFPDWQRQRQDILSRLPDAPPVGKTSVRRWLRPFLAAAAALVVAVAIKLSMAPGEVTPPVTNDLPVEEILAEVDAVLADESLPGFESIDFGVDAPASIFENGTS